MKKDEADSIVLAEISAMVETNIILIRDRLYAREENPGTKRSLLAALERIRNELYTRADSKNTF